MQRQFHIVPGLSKYHHLAGGRAAATATAAVASDRAAVARRDGVSVINGGLCWGIWGGKIQARPLRARYITHDVT